MGSRQLWGTRKTQQSFFFTYPSQGIVPSVDSGLWHAKLKDKFSCPEETMMKAPYVKRAAIPEHY